MLLWLQFNWPKRRVSTLCGCACPETMSITFSIAMRFPDCWATREKKKQKIQVFFPCTLSFIITILNNFFFLSFVKKCRASLETLSVLIWYAFPAFCCLWVQAGRYLRKKKQTSYLVTLFVLVNCFSCVPLFVTLWTVDCQAPLSRDYPDKNTTVGCHALLQGIFLTKDRTCIGRWVLYQ